MKEKIEFIVTQFNAVVGDIEGNSDRIIDVILSNRSLTTTKVFIFPELALCGYSPEDLLFRKDFAHKINNAINEIENIIENNEYLILGAPKYSEDYSKVWNSSFIINNKKTISIYDKQILPNYGVFDEKRYFEKGSKNKVLNIKGNKIGILICEDSWNFNNIYNEKLKNIDFLISINASPYEKGKEKVRINFFKKLSKKFAFNLIYLNTVGGQDEIVFDGSSFIVDRKGNIKKTCKSFSEESHNI